MTNAEKREAARQLIQKWHNKGREDEDDRSYWLDILQRLLGCADATDRIEFQKKVIVNGNTKKIDAYIPETKIIIEQKSEGIPLDKKISQSGGTELTPYEQANATMIICQLLRKQSGSSLPIFRNCGFTIWIPAFLKIML